MQQITSVSEFMKGDLIGHFGDKGTGHLSGKEVTSSVLTGTAHQNQ